VKKNVIANSKALASGIDLNYNAVGSPTNMMVMNPGKNPKSLIMTDSTHANS
jgi:hypothetical protein